MAFADIGLKDNGTNAFDISLSESVVTGTLNKTLGTLTTDSDGLVNDVVFARPSADVTDGSWTNQSGSNVDLYASVDETTYSDTDYIQSEASPSSSAVVLKLSDLSEAPIHTGHVLRYRYKRDTEGEAINLTIQLRQGYVNEGSQGTLIAGWTHNGISSSYTDGEQVLTEAEAANISDYTSLFVRMVASV